MTSTFAKLSMRLSCAFILVGIVVMAVLVFVGN